MRDFVQTKGGRYLCPKCGAEAPWFKGIVVLAPGIGYCKKHSEEKRNVNKTVARTTG